MAHNSDVDLGLFDLLDDVVFFEKDAEGRYVRVNRTLVERCGLGQRDELIGRTAAEVFPEPLGARYLAQDRRVLREGTTIENRLELHLYPGGHEGWCLTHKMPIRDLSGRVTGLAGLSRDLHAPDEAQEDYAAVAKALRHLELNLDQPLRVSELADRAGLSTYQFERRMRRIFGLNPRQFLGKARIDAACGKLRESEEPIAQIALDCGYADQSAFTRQFRMTVGMTPRQYRDAMGP
jgi:PAS domain S-box-containing protein